MPDLIKRGDLDTLYKRFNGAFLDGLLGQTPVSYQRIATEIPMDVPIFEFGILHDISGLREWTGDRHITKLKRSSYTAKVKKFERTLEVPRDNVEDDNLGLHVHSMRQLGEKARIWPDQQTWDALAANGACYDGKAFFAADHPEGSGTASNVDTSGSGSNWYLFDTTKALKPMLWLLRKAPEFVSQDDPKDDVVFRRDVYQYGVRARGVAAYGFWQLAFKSNDTLDDTNLNAAIQTMQARKNDEGESMEVNPNLLVVATDRRADAEALINMQIVASGGAGVSNRNFKKLEVMVVPRLPTA